MNCADEAEEGDQEAQKVSLRGSSRGKRVVQWEYDPSDLIKVRHPFRHHSAAQSALYYSDVLYCTVLYTPYATALFHS